MAWQALTKYSVSFPMGRFGSMVGCSLRTEMKSRVYRSNLAGYPREGELGIFRKGSAGQ